MKLAPSVPINALEFLSGAALCTSIRSEAEQALRRCRNVMKYSTPEARDWFANTMKHCLVRLLGQGRPAICINGLRASVGG